MVADYTLTVVDISLNPPALKDVRRISGKGERKSIIDRLKQDKQSSPSAKLILTEYHHDEIPKTYSLEEA